VVRVSVQQRVIDVDLDDDENVATISLELSIEDLFVERDGREELRLWQDGAGWSGYTREETDDGIAYFFVNAMHDEDPEEWPQRIRVGEQSVRDAVKDHIEDPKAGGRGRFIRQCPPPGDQTGTRGVAGP
jgi:hypothetical protein